MDSLEILETTDRVVEALGGSRQVAELTGSKLSAVSNWRKFKTFPSNTYLVMSQALQQCGKTAPASLWGQKVLTDFVHESAS